MVSLGPLRHAAFRRLATSYTLNELGWGFGTVALGLVVFDRTHSALAMTGLWICTLLVPAFVGPAATAQLDRLGVRRVLPVLYVAEAAIFAALALMTSSPLLGPRARSGRRGRDPRSRRPGADPRRCGRDAEADGRPRRRQHAAQRLLLAVLRDRPGDRRPGHRRMGRERSAVGQRGALRRDEHHAGHEPLAAARPRRPRRDLARARARGHQPRARKPSRSAASSSRTPSHSCAPR